MPFGAIKALLFADEYIYSHAQTYAFTVIAISQLFNAMGMRNLNRSIFKYNHFSNRLMIVAFVVAFSLQIAVTEIPFLIEAFDTISLTLKEWRALSDISTTPIWFNELFVFVKYLRKRS